MLGRGGRQERATVTLSMKLDVRQCAPAAVGLAALSLALALAAVPGIASAHAYYISSTPAAGAVLKAAPALVTVHFAENVNPTGSDMVVFDARHHQVSTAAAQVVTSDLKTMTVPMVGDGDGTYLVEWHTVSADDGDPDIGAFTFTVSASESVSAVPTATTSGTTKSGTGHAGGTSGGTPVWVTVLIGLAGLVAGAGGVYVVRRRAG